MADEARFEIGRRIAFARQARGLSQRGLASKLECSGPVVCQFEKGTGRTQITTVTRIAEALGVRPAWLAFGEDPVEPGSWSVTETVDALVTWANDVLGNLESGAIADPDDLVPEREGKGAVLAGIGLLRYLREFEQGPPAPEPSPQPDPEGYDWTDRGLGPENGRQQR